MAQTPVVPKSRKTVERARKQAPKDSVKKVKKAVSSRESTLRYEIAGAAEHDYQPVNAATWIQRFKEQVAISVAQIVFAREAAEAPK